MITVADFSEIPIKAQDANWEVDFNIAYKLVEPSVARRIFKKLFLADYETQVAILLSNIIYVDKVADASGNLTNSFETDILKTLLSSFPYYKTILANYAAMLQNMQYVQRKILQEQNLFEIGKYQYELDYGKQDAESKSKEETIELQETLGLYMNFEDEEPSNIVMEDTKVQLVTAKLPELLWKSNVPYLKLFNAAKYYTNEWGILNPIVIIELAKEANLQLINSLSFIPLIKAGYESMKSET